MSDDIIVLAEIRIPMDRVAEAVGPEVIRAVRGDKPKTRIQPVPQAVKIAVEHVVGALDQLERAKHTSGEGAAQRSLMAAVHGLRKAHLKARRQK